MNPDIKLRPLEREDLMFVHRLNNIDSVMRYWFEEPYESFAELSQLYERNIHNQTERRFIIANEKGDAAGLVELVEINHLHRSCEFQIAVDPRFQGHGYATRATNIAIDYAFKVLNIHKLYLHVDKDNTHAVDIYESCGFRPEGMLKDEFFVNGRYRDVVRMCLFQPEYLARSGAGAVTEPVLKS
ncbi:spermidine N(1)-acetyltransferase [Variibacter gotjawalensis]|uniref:Spermidine N(1)-acetyltransferase n=1 Tax=Variibacter gotjawalensis TaxID=1333996 RepID=A0A0S3PR99_9BRAD|nr:spermidine N1-acetyltransferase [Variibacter gotjawalensis]NIK48777.1 diamine N-acetyltransferase [Variibacter gotjawalensis]RZS50638.1 diamine N-acetyltransferase [Variibacter gotjawalensis]BAT58471.1 spermidine N(1)-acetyltransferase [Variibacter gotjawalensis]